MFFLHLERFTISVNDFDFDMNDLLFFLKDVVMRNFAEIPLNIFAMKIYRMF